MKRYDHPPPVLLIAKATEKEATKYIEYLKAENKILRSKLPKRVEVRSGRKTNSAFDAREKRTRQLGVPGRTDWQGRVLVFLAS